MLGYDPSFKDVCAAKADQKIQSDCNTDFLNVCLNDLIIPQDMLIINQQQKFISQLLAQNALEPYRFHHNAKLIGKKLFLHFGNTSKITVALFVLIFSTTTAVALYYTFFQEDHLTYSETEDMNLGDGVYFVPRSGWNARQPKNKILFTRKPPIVIVKHTGGGMCSDLKSCIAKMLALQSLFVGEKRMDDIDYHFVIGGDGNVYEGRGWDVQGEARLDCIVLCYIGNFVYGYDKPTEKMIKAGLRLLEKGLELGKLTEDYRVVAHNQTYNTQSPGENIYKEVQKWPHYYSGLMFKTYTK